MDWAHFLLNKPKNRAQKTQIKKKRRKKTAKETDKRDDSTVKEKREGKKILCKKDLTTARGNDIISWYVNEVWLIMGTCATAAGGG